MRIAQEGGNITSVVAYDADEPHLTELVLRVQDISRDAVLDAVAGHPGIQVLHVWDPGEPQSAA
jgi:hypothetical protein